MSAERIAKAKATPSASEDISGYESMTKEELIRELVLAKINEARAKKGYEVKGVGVEKEYIVYDSRNTK
jgi:transposase